MPTNQQLWGGETAKAVENFPISGEAVPVSVIHWLARIKAAAAAANGELGLLSKRSASRVEKAAAEIAAGKHDDQFPIDVFQTGSGTSTNTNANEVIASLAGDGVHPNDHVNMGQSSNDVFPSAVHLAALDVAQNQLLPALKQLERSFAQEGQQLPERRQGRAHPPDGRRPRDARPGVRWLRRPDRPSPRSASPSALVHVGQIPLGGTATGTGLNTHPRFAEKVRARLQQGVGPEADRRPAGPVRGAGQPRRAGRALRRAEGAGGVADQDRKRPRVDGLRPPRRHRRDAPARAPEGLLDHARQGQPGDPRGRPAGLRPGDRQRHRDHRRRHAGPVRAQRPHPADRPQPAAVAAACCRRQRGHSPRSASRASRPTRPVQTPPPAPPSPSRPRSTARSATTRGPPSSRRPRPPDVRCARSPSRRASTPSCTTRPSICGGSRGGTAGSGWAAECGA